MKIRDSVTTAGGARSNEDRVGHAGSLAWVIDGATDLYDDAALPAERDVVWLVDLVGALLTESGTDGYQGSGADLLERIAVEVHRQQEAYGFPSDRMPPACSIGLCVDRGDGFELTRIGDATAVIDGDTTRVLATSYFDGREAAAVRARETDPAMVVAAMQQRRRHTMTSGDVESVFSGHPQRRLVPHRITADWAGTGHILLCTDGFARLVTDYQLFAGWSEVVAEARERGVAYLGKLIRQTESDPAVGGDRFKRADDVAAVLICAG
ncbi:protein phosphatase 2C domain-containing protein [Micromonospora sp. LOL_028]|uniref:protein phosphatase 2C domain-containing protein n=1 Tax=Micromonospora sp. LOL_028 TaxID=3345420 RepID=UPI003A846311